MLGNEDVVHINVKLGSLLLEPPSLGHLKGMSVRSKEETSVLHLQRDKVVVVSVSLRNLQDQTGLLADEGLVGGVGDGGEAADAGGVREPGAGPTSSLRPLFRDGPGGGQGWELTLSLGLQSRGVCSGP